MQLDLFPVLPLGRREQGADRWESHDQWCDRKARLQFKTFVVHNFMDAADVNPAWDLMEKGIASDDPKIRETQERLSACMYTMSHPETGRLLPACVQHSVLDPVENIGLRKLLPIIDMSPTVVSRPSDLSTAKSLPLIA